MKVRIIKILTLCIIALISLVSVVCAEEPSVRLSVMLSPNNPSAGDNVTIELSLSDIQEGVKSVSFTLDYEEDVLEYVNVVAGEGWQAQASGKTITVKTANEQTTTTAGKIATVTLKVKADVEADTESAISLRAIQVIGDGEPIGGFNDLTKTITVSESSDPGTTDPGEQGNPSGNETDDDGDADGEDGESASGGQQNNDGEPVVNTLPIEKINEIGNYTTEDKEAPKVLPQTGEDVGIKLSIIGISILSIISYVIYRKNGI